jgi:MoaA/NifB/PqqE/SkfB family radical SAM enzyme
MRYTLYYRNYLKSCNYACGYCPFGKTVSSEKMLAKDVEYLQKFVEYLEGSSEHFNLFFAPRGEALLYAHYRQAIIRLSKLNHIGEIVIQTNLSSSLEWLGEVELGKVILWTTYHPSQVACSSFFQQIEKLRQYPVRFTIGMVGVKENFSEIDRLYQLLQKFSEKPPYLWINAYKDKARYYSEAEIAYLMRYDKLFMRNLKNYKCKDMNCKTGKEVFFIEWDGTIHRCWQDKKSLGNLYVEDLTDISASTVCHQKICSCFIGYSHITALQLQKDYTTSLLGRIP